MKHVRIYFILVEDMYHDLGITVFAYSSLTSRPMQAYASFAYFWNMLKSYKNCLQPHDQLHVPTPAYASKGNAYIYHFQCQPPEWNFCTYYKKTLLMFIFSGTYCPTLVRNTSNPQICSRRLLGTLHSAAVALKHLSFALRCWSLLTFIGQFWHFHARTIRVPLPPSFLEWCDILRNQHETWFSNIFHATFRAVNNLKIWFKQPLLK